MPTTIDSFHDATTGTVTHLLTDAATGEAAVIDPVLDFDPRAARTGTTQAARLLEALRERGGRLAWILETHVHADHVSAARWLQREAGGRIAVGARIREVQAAVGRLFHLGDALPADGRPFDRLLAEGDVLPLGESALTVMEVPGHTPADVAFRVDDAVFVGDTLFLPDVGTARTDFPGGDARTLYRSIRRLLALPPGTRLFVCHDYPTPGRGPAWVTTVAAQRAANLHVADGVSEDDFVRVREARDATLDVPALMLPALQFNVRAGDPPPPEADGRAYLKLPVDAFPAPRR